MIAYNKPQTHPSNNAIVVVPSAARYADQQVDVMCAAYNCQPNETFRAAQFRQHREIFPEGQFIALDVNADRVVGLTVSMRVDFDPRKPLLERWVETTNYG